MRRIPLLLRRQFSVSQSEPAKLDKIGILFFSGISAGTFGLGVWQVSRYFEKEELINEIQSSLDGAPKLIPTSSTQFESASQVRQLSNQKLVIEGEYQHDKEILVGIRSAPIGYSAAAQGMAQNPQGYFVYTPIVRKSDGLVMVVNRGWVPMSMVKGENNKEKGSWSRPLKPVQIVTLLTEPEKGNYFLPSNLSPTMNTPPSTYSTSPSSSSSSSTPSSSSSFIPRILGWVEGKALIQYCGLKELKDKYRPSSSSPTFSPSLSSSSSTSSPSNREHPQEIEEKEKEKKRNEAEFNEEELILLTAIQPDLVPAKASSPLSPASSPSSSSSSSTPKFPFPSPLSTAAEQRIPPHTHAIYALTWFMLAFAGFSLTFFKFRANKRLAKRLVNSTTP